MKIADIRKLSTVELTDQSTKLREEIVQMRRQIATGELTASRAIRVKRRDLARVLTVLGEQLAKEAN